MEKKVLATVGLTAYRLGRFTGLSVDLFEEADRVEGPLERSSRLRGATMTQLG